ncbi:hypothetical protein [Jannaschia pohangensis]|uniref:Uncharacterized protein n=1 Tax=Jannaschia pohangensis TaxID=390807 RepID=A0A1I3NPP6_9RHOB|nr:hypothetical protein [Jannaschia pohangensis]SFJ11149.1 hypothetical protein SAMN04488095_2213 [Jannaschia pohangensis]
MCPTLPLWAAAVAVGLVSTASMATGEPTRAEVIADMSRGVDMCLDALRTGDTRVIEALQTVYGTSVAVGTPTKALPKWSARLRLETLEEGTPDVRGCHVGTTDEWQESLVRPDIMTWAESKMTDVTADTAVTRFPVPVRLGGPARVWCEQSVGLFASIGHGLTGQGVDIAISRIDPETPPSPNTPPNPCNPE